MYVGTLKGALLLGGEEEKEMLITCELVEIQRSRGNANGPVWFRLADDGSPRLRYPAGPPLSALHSWSAVGSF